MNLQQLTKSSFSLLLMLCLAGVAFGQQPDPQVRVAVGTKAIAGTVRDADGNPIEGVTVSIKGRSGTVLTDAKGNYILGNAEVGETAVFTHIAFATKEIKIADRSVNVSLEKSNTSLEDVVVVGYGTQKK